MSGSVSQKLEASRVEGVRNHIFMNAIFRHVCARFLHVRQHASVVIIVLLVQDL